MRLWRRLGRFFIAWFEERQIVFPPPEAASLRKAVEYVKSKLEVDEAKIAWAKGQFMTLTQVTDFLLSTNLLGFRR